MYMVPNIQSRQPLNYHVLLYPVELLFILFEPLIGKSCIQYANGLDWEERRKALYPTLRDECLENYIDCFIKVRTTHITFNYVN